MHAERHAARTDMKRHGNLFARIVDPDNLHRAWMLAKENKPSLRAVKKFALDVEGNLSRIRQGLIDKTFTTSRYTSKVVYEPKQRTIYVLPFSPDRVVQHALMNVLIPIWQPMFISDSYACITGRGQHAGSRRTMEFVRRNRYCLKCDVHHFYVSVVHDILYDMIERKIKCPDTLWLIRDIVYSFPGGKNVPIGNLTSQWFGNYYLTALDRFVKERLHVADYVRYCDDFILFGNDKKQLNEFSKAIVDFLAERLQLTLSKCDLFPVSRGVDFLGYRHFPDYILLRKSTAKRMARRLRELPGRLEAGLIEPERARSVLASAAGWAKWANTYNFRQAVHLDDLVEMVNGRCRERAAEEAAAV